MKGLQILTSMILMFTLVMQLTTISIMSGGSGIYDEYADFSDTDADTLRWYDNQMEQCTNDFHAASAMVSGKYNSYDAYRDKLSKAGVGYYEMISDKEYKKKDREYEFWYSTFKECAAKQDSLKNIRDYLLYVAKENAKKQ